MTDRHDTVSVINPSGQDCLALAATIASASVACAEAVRFDNTDNYSWFYSVLDLTLPSQDQSYGSVNDVSGTSLYLDYFADFYPSFTYFHTYLSGAGAELWNSGFNNRYAQSFDSGQMIGPGMNDGAWNQGSTLEFAWFACDYYYYNGYYYYDCTSGTRGLLPSDGSPTYIGARLTIDNNLHYGWIGVTNNFGFIDVFAWGYETEPGVAVRAGAVPAPGAMGLLALGAAGVLSRRTRSA